MKNREEVGRLVYFIGRVYQIIDTLDSIRGETKATREIARILQEHAESFYDATAERLLKLKERIKEEFKNDRG